MSQVVVQPRGSTEPTSVPASSSTESPVQENARDEKEQISYTPKVFLSCEDYALGASRYNCYEKEAVATGDASSCGKISNTLARDSCYWQFVLDPGFDCSVLSSERQRTCQELVALT